MKWKVLHFKKITYNNNCYHKWSTYDPWWESLPNRYSAL